MMDIAGKTVPVNFGPLKDADFHSRLTGPCGDTMEFWLKIEQSKLERCTYTTDGCQESIIYGGLVVEEALKLDIEINSNFIQTLTQAINRKQVQKSHCITLSLNTLEISIKSFLKSQKRKKIFTKLGREKI